MDKRLGFIGAGAMAEALIKGILQSKMIAAERIYISDLREERLEELEREYKIKAVQDNKELVSASDIIILAVKPKVISIVLEEVANLINPKQQLVSIAAGITSDVIESYFNSKVAVIRLMPNTPALIGAGAIAYSLGSYATSAEDELIEEIFSTVGSVTKVEEDLMDGVTALSGSGPAYIYLIIEALADAGVNVGLSRNTAMTLAVQTILGATKMVEELGEHPAKLKNRVTSPGGTTITGLKVLEEAGVRSAFYQAIEAATAKSKELRGEE